MINVLLINTNLRINYIIILLKMLILKFQSTERLKELIEEFKIIQYLTYED